MEQDYIYIYIYIPITRPGGEKMAHKGSGNMLAKRPARRLLLFPVYSLAHGGDIKNSC
jgi:hypothetical protein